MPTDTFFSGTGTWTVPAGVTSVSVEAWGSGGGGGNGNGANGGGGGGGAGYCNKVVAVTPGDTFTYTIAVGGAGGVGAGISGSDGNTTTVASSLLTPSMLALGGHFGRGTATGGGGGSGGNATGGSTNSTGSTGVNGSAGTGGTGGDSGSIVAGTPGHGGNGHISTSSTPGIDGQVSFTYTLPATTITASFNLYISTICAAGLRPSGDFAQYPSGHWFNLVGGSGNYWSNVNTDPDWQVTDNDYITTIQSGFIDRTNRIYYTTSNSSGNLNAKYYDLLGASSGTVVNNIVGTFLHSKECTTYDIENSPINLVSRMDGNLPSARTIISNINSTFTSYNCYDIVYDRKNKRVLYIFGTTGGSIDIWSIAPDGISTVLLTSIAMTNIDSIKANIDYRSNKLQLLLHSSTAFFATHYQILWVDLTSPTNVTSFPASTTATVNSIVDFSFDNRNSNYYIDYFTYTGTYNSEYIPSGTFAAGGFATTLPYNSFCMKADGWKQNVFYTSGNTLFQSSLSGTSITNKYVDSNGINSISFDGPEFYASIDFPLTQLPPGFGTTNVLEQVTNAYVTLTAQENFDFSNVYAKIIKQDQTVLWENYPESCAQFPQASGKMKLNIGYTGSVINTNFNSLNDWNNSLLRLEVFSLNDNQPSGNFRIYNAQVNAFCSGTTPTGTSISGSFTLFCRSAGPASGSFPLYIPGQTSNGTCPLFIDGGALASGTFPLYISGAFPNSSLPLCMLGPQVSSGSSFFNLFAFSLSSTRSGIFNDFNLYLAGDQSPNSSLPLYILNTEGKFSSGNLPLSLIGGIGGVNGSLSLYINNLYSASGFPLYTFGQGSGTLGPLGPYGGVPYAQSIPLYIKRPNIVGVLPLCVFNQQQNNTLNLYTFSANPASGQIPLVIPNTFGSGTNQMNLYTSGY